MNQNNDNTKQKQIIELCKVDEKQAKKAVAEWVIASAGNANAWSMSAYVHAYFRDYDRALVDIEKAINIQPVEPCNYFDKSRYAIAIFEYNTAIEALSLSLRKGKEHNFHYYDSVCYLSRALCYCKIGEFEKAEADLEKIEDDGPIWIDKLRSKPELLEACLKGEID